MSDEKGTAGISRRGIVTSTAAGLIAAGLGAATTAASQADNVSARRNVGGRKRVIIDTDPGVDDAADYDGIDDMASDRPAAGQAGGFRGFLSRLMG